MNDLKDIFDDSIVHLGMTSVKLASGLNQSQDEKASRVLGSTNTLIDQVMKLAENQFKSVQKIAMVDYPIIIARITQNRINEDAKIIDGQVEVIATLRTFSPLKKVAKISIIYPIRFGHLKEASFFQSSVGKTYSFNQAGIKTAMRIRDFNAKTLSTRRFAPAQLAVH